MRLFHIHRNAEAVLQAAAHDLQLHHPGEIVFDARPPAIVVDAGKVFQLPIVVCARNHLAVNKPETRYELFVVDGIVEQGALIC